MIKVKVTYNCSKYYKDFSTRVEIFEMPKDVLNDRNGVRNFLIKKFNVGLHDVNIFYSEIIK